MARNAGMTDFAATSQGMINKRPRRYRLGIYLNMTYVIIFEDNRSRRKSPIIHPDLNSGTPLNLSPKILLDIAKKMGSFRYSVQVNFVL